MNSTTQPRHIRLLDTTLRDGEQTQGVSFSANEKLNIARALLQSLRVDRIEVASACVSDGEKEAVAQIIEWAESEGLADRVEVLDLSTTSAVWTGSGTPAVRLSTYCVKAVKNIVGSSSARRWMDMLKISSEP